MKQQEEFEDIAPLEAWDMAAMLAFAVIIFLLGIGVYQVWSICHPWEFMQ